MHSITSHQPLPLWSGKDGLESAHHVSLFLSLSLSVCVHVSVYVYGSVCVYVSEDQHIHSVLMQRRTVHIDSAAPFTTI